MSSLAHAPPPQQDDEQDVLIQFDDNTFEPVAPYEENFEDQVREAQEQLALLRQREERLERQKHELEELHERKATFSEGRTRLGEDLTRAISSLERESEDAQRHADQCLNSKEALEHQHRIIESLRPETWSRGQLHQELSRGMSQLEETEAELNSAAPLLATIRGGGGKRAGKNVFNLGGDAGRNFLYWFRSGLAFTLPAMIFAAVVWGALQIFGGM